MSGVGCRCTRRCTRRWRVRRRLGWAMHSLSVRRRTIRQGRCPSTARSGPPTSGRRSRGRGRRTGSLCTGQVPGVDAAPVCWSDRRCLSRASAGVFHSSVLRGPVVKSGGDCIEVVFVVVGQVGPFGEVLAQQPVRVLVGASLSLTVWIAEVDRDAGVDAQLSVLGHLTASGRGAVAGCQTSTIGSRAQPLTGGLSRTGASSAGSSRSVRARSSVSATRSSMRVSARPGHTWGPVPKTRF